MTSRFVGRDKFGELITRAEICPGIGLAGADFRNADLRCTYLDYANLEGADFRGADLTSASFCNANLCGADLRETIRNTTFFDDAKLDDAKLPDVHSRCPQKGAFRAYKKLAGGGYAELLIPAEARRTGTLVGNKCRAEFADVVSICNWMGNERQYGVSIYTSSYRLTEFIYVVGKRVVPDSYNGDIRVECTGGIHFFATFAEAERYMG
jgi:hypothetical protein